MDELCRVRPRGSSSVLYVRFGADVGFGGERFFGGYENPDGMMFIFTPTTDAPDETYQIRAYRNFLSEDYSQPFAAGQVVRIENPLGPQSLDGIQTEFTL